MTFFTLLLFLVSSVQADDLGCLCEACYVEGDDGVICTFPGATVINATSCDTGCTNDACGVAFQTSIPSSASLYAMGCEAVDTDTWDGEWDLDPCDNGCLLTPGLLGDCLPCCDETTCDCVHGNIEMTQSDDGTINMTIGTTHFASASYTFVRTGNAGYTATGNVSGSVYDVKKDGDHITFTQQIPVSFGYQCSFSATRNPSTTDWLKLGLLIGGVSVGALLLVLVFCFNPFKKCRKNKETNIQTEGQPYKPLASAPSETHAGVNFTGGNYNDL